MVNELAKSFKDVSNKEFHVYVEGLAIKSSFKLLMAKLNFESCPKLLGAYFLDKF